MAKDSGYPRVQDVLAASRGRFIVVSTSVDRAWFCPRTAVIVGDVSGTEDFERGLRIRREVLGDEFVDANLAGSDAFMMTFQRLVTELAWGRAWSGTALDRKTKALLSLGILAALGRHEELRIYVQGALASGATVSEIEEVLVHVTIYCGTPAGRQSFLAVHNALRSAGAIPIGEIPVNNE